MKLQPAWLSSKAVQALAQAFDVSGYQWWFVGGAVRDALMGKEATDLDATTEALPDQVIDLLARAGIRAIPTGIEHGTVTALIDAQPIEITTLRNDVATDGRHARVSYTADMNEDAHRRDFTMNAVYLSHDGTLYDPVGGVEDAKQHHVRFIGNPNTRIAEDYLRILRYFRFLATVGRSQIDVEAMAACKRAAPHIASLSGERIAAELLKLLRVTQTQEILARMQEVGVFEAIMPGYSWDINSVGHLEAFPLNDLPPLLKLAVFIEDSKAVAPLSERLKLSGKQTKQITLWLSHASAFLPVMTEFQQKKLVRRLGAEDYKYAVYLACAKSGGVWSNYSDIAAMSSWKPPLFPVRAADLMERGYQAGKELGDRLNLLEQRWEESEYTLSKEALLSD